MKKVIDVRDMHNACHSFYLVTAKPKTTCKLFWFVSTFNDKEENFPDDFEQIQIWDKINKNTECLGETNYRNIQGDKIWKNGQLTSHNVYDDGENKFLVIGSFDIY